MYVYIHSIGFWFHCMKCFVQAKLDVFQCCWMWLADLSVESFEVAIYCLEILASPVPSMSSSPARNDTKGMEEFEFFRLLFWDRRVLFTEWTFRLNWCINDVNDVNGYETFKHGEWPLDREEFNILQLQCRCFGPESTSQPLVVWFEQTQLERSSKSNFLYTTYALQRIDGRKYVQVLHFVAKQPRSSWIAATFQHASLVCFARQNFAKTCCGSPLYLSPEIVNQEPQLGDNCLTVVPLMDDRG